MNPPHASSHNPIGEHYGCAGMDPQPFVIRACRVRIVGGNMICSLGMRGEVSKTPSRDDATTGMTDSQYQSHPID